MTLRRQALQEFYARAVQEPPRRATRTTYYEEIDGFLELRIPVAASVLDLGCGTGEGLARLVSAGSGRKALGVDLSSGQIDEAKKRHAHLAAAGRLAFEVGDVEDPERMEALAGTHGTFDAIVLVNLVGEVEDLWPLFRNLRPFCHDATRIHLIHYNYLWEPVMKIASFLGLRQSLRDLNWLPLEDIVNLLEVNDFEKVESGFRCLSPVWFPLLSTFANRILARLPWIERLALIQYVIARPVGLGGRAPHREFTVSVVVPCRNEKGNIRDAVSRLPNMGRHTEIVFVDGESTDGTVEEIRKVIDEEKGRRDIRLLLQRPARGKGDAVRIGFDAARGEILMILDADLTAAPEDLPKFYLALAEGKGEFVNGSRLVYPMESQAMRFANLLGNKFFAMAFSWLMGQPVRDTLCGTKVLFQRDWDRISAGRDYFGEFDPFGDFDLLFGASKLGMRIREIPVRYRDRTYGATKISRWSHGWLLLRMCGVALRKIKFR